MKTEHKTTKDIKAEALGLIAACIFLRALFIYVCYLGERRYILITEFTYQSITIGGFVGGILALLPYIGIIIAVLGLLLVRVKTKRIGDKNER